MYVHVFVSEHMTEDQSSARDLAELIEELAKVEVLLAAEHMRYRPTLLAYGQILEREIADLQAEMRAASQR
jgi:hypothetical protein